MSQTSPGAGTQLGLLREQYMLISTEPPLQLLPFILSQACISVQSGIERTQRPLESLKGVQCDSEATGQTAATVPFLTSWLTWASMRYCNDRMADFTKASLLTAGTGQHTSSRVALWLWLGSSGPSLWLCGFLVWWPLGNRTPGSSSVLKKL